MADSNEASRIEAGVENLGKAGFSINVGILPLDLIASLVAEQRRREDNGELALAGLGRGGSHSSGGSQRQVESSWFDNQSAAERHFSAFAERVRLVINRRLMLGLFEFEAQFLHYPPGGFYRRHVDALRGERNRVVSMVAYLNEDWSRDDGGELSVWAEGGEGEPVAEVVPLAGTVVLMLSELIPHEAKVARRDRRAIAGWFSVNTSSSQRINPARL
ncbi:MAG: 2OG-Fe(II) oxygenase [Hyphomicrobiaceae bacterium]